MLELMKFHECIGILSVELCTCRNINKDEFGKTTFVVSVESSKIAIK